MTRIIAGTARGRRLRTPPGSRTRPTTDRVRESLFASLVSEMGGLDGLRVLDLYAGSGAVGLEALSRGALEAVMVEVDARTCDVVRENVRLLGLPGSRVVRSKVRTHLEGRPEHPFDVVFLDPPYDVSADDVADDLAALALPGWLDPDAVVVVERSARGGHTWPAGLEALRDRTYGETTLWYGQPHA
ncbi:16S rRNA (guanine(966)-N(2))-methyltransferase RsmD [Solicola sp. PLA-1-18]|uniref:16S rRNA (guanine(966)-N(2))-methyltransferase RsmD n=1 Tax=Solicola sp. PLA-1-18 TaxID=3380532 RepID=UPI003B7ED902